MTPRNSVTPPRIANSHPKILNGQNPNRRRSSIVRIGPTGRLGSDCRISGMTVLVTRAGSPLTQTVRPVLTGGLSGDGSLRAGSGPTPGNGYWRDIRLTPQRGIP